MLTSYLNLFSCNGPHWFGRECVNDCARVPNAPLYDNLLVLLSPNLLPLGTRYPFTLLEYSPNHQRKKSTVFSWQNLQCLGEYQGASELVQMRCLPTVRVNSILNVQQRGTSSPLLLCAVPRESEHSTANE